MTKRKRSKKLNVSFQRYFLKKKSTTLAASVTHSKIIQNDAGVAEAMGDIMRQAFVKRKTLASSSIMSEGYFKLSDESVDEKNNRRVKTTSGAIDEACWFTDRTAARGAHR